MSDVIYRMYGTLTSASTDSVVTVDIQDNGFIEGVLMDLTGTGMDALDDIAAAEISFGSSNAFTQNDARASIAMLRLTQNFLTSGGGASGKSVFLAFPKGIPVGAGERVHMHMSASTGVTALLNAYLYCTVNSRRRTARRNR